MNWGANNGLRIPVGTHYRVWWFWLPIIFGGLALLAAAVMLPIFPTVGALTGTLALVCLAMAAIAGVVIERGRRWIELSDDRFRLSNRHTQVVIADEQVTDLAIRRQPHHGAGKLLAETRHLILWVDTPTGPEQLKLASRMAPDDTDPLQPLIDRLRHRIGEQAARDLAGGDTVDGEGWALDNSQLHVSTRRQRTSVALEEIAAVETIGSEVRIWRHADPYTLARLPVSGRNGWLLEKLLTHRLARHSERPEATPHDPMLQIADTPESKASPLGRILFERSPGSGPTVIFGVMGLLLGVVGGISLWVAIQGRDPVMSAGGGLLLLLSAMCFAGGLRVRRVRFRCYERGLERVTMTGRKVLPFDDIDVFSFESRRNHSQGRYTGTTYTLVFADRSREQGRGIFYSTTIRNHDEELEDLRERVSQVIARRMAQTFAAHHSVQWTPEIWFRNDALEYIRRRRWFVPTKVVVVPYDTITDFELRDGLFHVWTSYQDRAVLSVGSGAPNFYPGLIVLEGLSRAWKRKPKAAAV